ncbi:hypothetical protein BGZ61DRAFT_204945 [Ilyonectria robusta]|uniref:uncharacterized protein n=1 Tax=Ilyonectria robusta TaxID=1079257 RepID=UPI001E8E338D|nr:uncharacterized protein BGZ61DRAFT_204945 [Ilyonectria robusta]KAH8654196.1 hypothetical protein BGZ61DRAFT_204945 [Ilyonectria robusta]
MVFRCVAMKEMSWLWRSPTAMALFHRLTMLCVLRICSTPSGVNAVLSTNLHGALNRQRSPFPLFLPREYLTQVGLWVWICVAPAQKLASSSNAAENCSVLSSREEISDVTDRSACTTQNPSWSRSCLVCQPRPVCPPEVLDGQQHALSITLPLRKHYRRIGRCAHDTPPGPPRGCRQAQNSDARFHATRAAREREAPLVHWFPQHHSTG